MRPSPERPQEVTALLGSEVPGVRQVGENWAAVRSDYETAYADKGIFGRFANRMAMHELDNLALGAAIDSETDALAVSTN